VFLFKYALLYYLAVKSSKMSFAELFADLEHIVDNPKRRWKYVLRVKRGLIDTSLPGGLYKDQAYLEGAVKILRERNQLDFRGLYAGKLALEDFKRPFIQKKCRLEKIKLPVFMKDMKQYRKALEIIAKYNFIEEPVVVTETKSNSKKN
jgi:hypothetical protein